MRIKDVFKTPPLNKDIVVRGWVRTRRDSGQISFIELNDGSCLANLQVVLADTIENYQDELKKITTGCSLEVGGKLLESPAKGQAVELQASSLELIGGADPQVYPLQKKRHGFEFLRSISHLRPRTNALGSVARVRGQLSFALHEFFFQQGFQQVHTPIITTSDCEGAGEMFTVTTLGPEQITGEKSFQDDFFHKKANLTVSGQLQLEAYALALGQVYSFGPTFRAENSNTSRHLAEFWMVEPEMAFCDLAGDMDMAEKMVRFVVSVVLARCGEDLELFARFVDKGLLIRLEKVAKDGFSRMSYTEAIDILLQEQGRGKDFVYPVSWGIDLQSEHEKFLCEEIAAGPLFITDYPADIKPFYMRSNDDGKTVAAMDLLVPTIGELIGGSQREERYGILEKKMKSSGLDLAEYDWYLDLRRYGTVPHAGFGLGFERLVQMVTGMGNIRDVIPFPRAPGFSPC